MVIICTNAIARLREKATVHDRVFRNRGRRSLGSFAPIVDNNKTAVNLGIASNGKGSFVFRALLPSQNGNLTIQLTARNHSVAPVLQGLLIACNGAAREAKRALIFQRDKVLLLDSATAHGHVADVADARAVLANAHNNTASDVEICILCVVRHVPTIAPIAKRTSALSDIDRTRNGATLHISGAIVVKRGHAMGNIIEHAVTLGRIGNPQRSIVRDGAMAVRLLGVIHVLSDRRVDKRAAVQIKLDALLGGDGNRLDRAAQQSDGCDLIASRFNGSLDSCKLFIAHLGDRLLGRRPCNGRDQHRRIVSRSGFRRASIRNQASVSNRSAVDQRNLMVLGAAVGLDGHPCGDGQLAIALGHTEDFKRVARLCGLRGIEQRSVRIIIHFCICQCVDIALAVFRRAVERGVDGDLSHGQFGIGHVAWLVGDIVDGKPR